MSEPGAPILCHHLTRHVGLQREALAPIKMQKARFSWGFNAEFLNLHLASCWHTVDTAASQYPRMCYSLDAAYWHSSLDLRCVQPCFTQAAGCAADASSSGDGADCSSAGGGGRGRAPRPYCTAAAPGSTRHVPAPPALKSAPRLWLRIGPLSRWPLAPGTHCARAAQASATAEKSCCIRYTERGTLNKEAYNFT